MIEEVKNLRVKIDGLAQLTKSLEQEITVVDLSTIPHNQTVEEHLHNLKNGLSINQESRKIFIPSKEVLKTIDNLYLAKAWLGKVLGELGTDNPYGSGYKTKEDIGPTQDVNLALGDNSIDKYHEKNHIEKVDWLRQEIEKVILEFQNIELADLENKISQYLTDNVKTYLCEARFWLGFELGRCKDEK